MIHALADVALRLIPIDLALIFAAGGDEENLRALLEVRRRGLAAALEDLVAHRRRARLIRYALAVIAQQRP